MLERQNIQVLPLSFEVCRSNDLHYHLCVGAAWVCFAVHLSPVAQVISRSLWQAAGYQPCRRSAQLCCLSPQWRDRLAGRQMRLYWTRTLSLVCCPREAVRLNRSVFARKDMLLLWLVHPTPLQVGWYHPLGMLLGMACLMALAPMILPHCA